LTTDPSKRESVECLTAFFNRALVSGRPLADERNFMRKRRERLVYGYTSEWAASAAGEVRGCGGLPTFVVPWKS